MTLVDRILLQFSMQDEGFARGLYMGWDEFCRRSVTGVMDEFFARYDSKEAYIEMDRLELDLGGIQQEEFYELFPVRLREALERAFIQKLNETGIAASSAVSEVAPATGIAAGSMTDAGMGSRMASAGDTGAEPAVSSMRVPQKLRPGQKCSAGFEVGLQIRLNGLLERLGVQQPADCKSTGTVRDRRNSWGLPELLEHPLYALEKRFENLLHYLEYGFCLPQWESASFDLYEELLRFRDTKHLELLLTLTVAKPYVMERLILQTEPARLPEVLPFATWLQTEALGHSEKQKFLSTVLELAPQSMIRFIHETKGDSSLEGMGELLENPHIRRIMKAETENHAEIDVPEYWYRLYGWLFEYYPFNGVPMFGDKRHFKLHLGRKLISFIQKREQQSYLSKADLTLQFLLEVFGADNYLTVLNIIYHNQRLNADGSPATGDSYAWELYYMLLRLSMLQIDQNTNDYAGIYSNDSKYIGGSEFLPNENMADSEYVPAAGEVFAAPSLKDMTDGADGKLFDRLAAWLLSPSVSDTEKSQMLRHYARWQPELLWKFVRYSAAEDSHKRNIPFGRWNTWLGTSDWLEMVSGVSISLSETLRMTVGTVSGKYGLSETILAESMVQFIAVHPADRIYYADASIVVKEYLSIASSLAWKGGIPDAVWEHTATVTGDSRWEFFDEISLSDEQETAQELVSGDKQPEQGETKKTLGSDESERPSSVVGGNRSEQGETVKALRSGEREAALGTLVRAVESELHIAAAEQALEGAAQPEYIEIPNAGLCLLAMWLPRLFDMLGLLTEDKKALKDTEARIRAIFILQRLVTDDPREYKEQELAFNRILTACPFYVPLPKTLELTEAENQTATSMLAGVKSNWSKMSNTSVKGFQRSFIERPGKLEQREEKWMLYVEPRAYDILLDSLPWSYRQIRLPWLKKKINVMWRDKEEFDF